MPSPQDHLVSIIAGIPLTMENWESVEELDDGFKTETEQLVEDTFGKETSRQPEPLTEDEYASLERMFGKARVAWWRSSSQDGWGRYQSISQLREMSKLKLDPEIGNIYDERYQKMMERKAKPTPGSLRTYRDKHGSEDFKYPMGADMFEPRTWIRAQVMSLVLSNEDMFFPAGIDSVTSTIDAIIDNVIRRIDGDSFESSTAKIEIEVVERVGILNSMRSMHGHTKPWLSVKQWKEEKTSVKAAPAKDWSDL